MFTSKSPLRSFRRGVYVLVSPGAVSRADPPEGPAVSVSTRMPGWDARKLSPEMWRSGNRPGWGWEWQKGTGVGAPEKQNKTHSSGAVSTQVHSRTRASWWLLAGRSRDHLSPGSERWPRSGPPLHPRAQMTSATEPQGWDGARCPAARAQCTGLRALPHRRGPGLGAASSQAQRDWDHRTRPSSQPR